MIYQWFDTLYTFTGKHIRLISVVFIILILLSAAGLRSIRFDNNIEIMLPADEKIAQSLSFLHDSDLAGTVVLSLSLKEPGDTGQLFRGVSELAHRLEGPLVSDIISGPPDVDMRNQIVSYLGFMPQLISPEALQFEFGALDDELIERRMNQAYRQALMPGSNFTMTLFQKDPLRISSNLLQNLRNLTASFGYRVRIRQGHFLSEDGRHSLLILHTPVPLTDSIRSRELLDHINDAVNSVSVPMNAVIISGHRHAVSNGVKLQSAASGGECWPG